MKSSHYLVFKATKKLCRQSEANLLKGNNGCYETSHIPTENLLSFSGCQHWMEAMHIVQGQELMLLEIFKKPSKVIRLRTIQNCPSK